MIIPIRCFTCGRVIAQDYETWKGRVAAGEDAALVMDDLDIDRYCCRRMILGQADLLQDSSVFE